MTIQELKPSTKKEGRWLVVLEDGTIIRVSEADVADLGLYRGMELSPEQAEQLQEAAALSKLKARALNIVSVRSISRKELVKKLSAPPRRQAGEEGSEDWEEDRQAAQEKAVARAEAAADWLERLGLLNDEQYAKDVVRYCEAKGFGARRIRDELFRRGIPRELWDEALEERGDSSEAINRFLLQKLKNWTGDLKELKRATDALVRKGFSWSEISEALARYETELEE